MKTKLAIILGSAFLATSAFAVEKVEVKVKGMVCSFCAQGIKKKFSGNDAISKVEVNLDDKWVRLEIVDKKVVSDDQISAAIKDAGYDVVSIDRAGKAAASAESQ